MERVHFRLLLRYTDIHIFVSDMLMKRTLKCFSDYVLVKIELLRILLKNNLLDSIKNLVVVRNVVFFTFIFNFYSVSHVGVTVVSWSRRFVVPSFCGPVVASDFHSTSVLASFFGIGTNVV